MKQDSENKKLKKKLKKKFKKKKRKREGGKIKI